MKARLLGKASGVLTDDIISSQNLGGNTKKAKDSILHLPTSTIVGDPSSKKDVKNRLNVPEGLCIAYTENLVI